MRITCTQENLNQGVFVVSHIAAKSTALPILNNVLIQAKQNTIRLSATNLELGVSCVIRGKVEEEGEFTVPSRLLADYIALLPREKVDLESPKEADDQDQSLRVAAKNHHTKIKGQPATDFPVIPQVEKQNEYRVDPADFRELVSQVIFAVSASETRPEISGVYFRLGNGKLVAAATDRYRLAEKTVELVKGSAAEEREVIVPARALQEVQRILGSFKDPAAISEINAITIYIADSQAAFTIGDVELVTRLVEGKYPDYTQIIPQQTTTEFSAGGGDFTNVVKAASLFARSGIYDVKVAIAAEANELVVSSTNSQLGENTSRLAGEAKGASGEVVINYRYLLDGLQNISGDQVSLGLTEGNGPCVLKAAGKQSDYLYIIMPIMQ